MRPKWRPEPDTDLVQVAAQLPEQVPQITRTLVAPASEKSEEWSLFRLNWKDGVALQCGFYEPKPSDSKNVESWEERGSHDMGKRAHMRWTQM